VKPGKDRPRDLAASARQRLLNLAKARGEDFTFVLNRFALERLLFRLGESRHAASFVLKGAMLFPLWSGSAHRATKDMDLLGYGPPDHSRVAEIFRELAATVCEDGLIFEPDSVAANQIRKDSPYGGIRVTLTAHLSAARIPLQVDVGFGDDVTPTPVEVPYPTLLDFPPPRLRAYQRETVVAEKLHAIVDLGFGNSRMKDFFDLWFLARNFEFDGQTLGIAVRATFNGRRTPLPAQPPIGLTRAFAEDPAKQKQWIAFVARSRLVERPDGFAVVIDKVCEFLWPIISATADGPGTWTPSIGWHRVGGLSRSKLEHS
jgi:predicted nucleotidyltransferase component of viral defense system